MDGSCPGCLLIRYFLDSLELDHCLYHSESAMLCDNFKNTKYVIMQTLTNIKIIKHYFNIFSWKARIRKGTCIKFSLLGPYPNLRGFGVLNVSLNFMA